MHPPIAKIIGDTMFAELPVFQDDTINLFDEIVEKLQSLELDSFMMISARCCMATIQMVV